MMAEDCCRQDASDGMMSETFYPMTNHTPWKCDSGTDTPVLFSDKETQFDGMLEDRSTSMGDVQAIVSSHPSGDSGFGEHALLPQVDDVRRDESSSSSSQGGGSKMASSAGLYSEAASPERDQFCLEDEIVHLSEEPLSSRDDGDERCGIVSSQDDVPRMTTDTVDGAPSLANYHDDDNCALDCVYYTLKCCDCRII